MSKDLILSLKDLSYVYKEECSLKIRLDALTLYAGESVALTGVSGSGKSTLLECLGLIRPGFEASEYLFSGFDLLKSPLKKRALLRSALMGIMPQQGALIPFLRIKDDFKLTVNLACRARAELGMKETLSHQESFKQAVLLADKLGIGNLLERYPESLSQGQRQRASFIKALVHSPKLLLIDEPTAALDPVHAKELFEIVLGECGKRKLCALVVTHDLTLAHELKLKICAYDSALSHDWINVFKELS